MASVARPHAEAAVSRAEFDAALARLAALELARLDDRDGRILGPLLAAIFSAVADATFTAASIRALAELRADDGDVTLLDALNAAGSQRQIGRLLRRARGIPVGGLTVECCGGDNSRIWLLRRVEIIPR